MNLTVAPSVDEPAWVAGLGKWMRRDWHHFASLTTPHHCSRHALVHQFKDKFVRRLARSAQHSIGWFYVIEESADLRPHIHALLWRTSGLPIRRLRGAWDLGITDVVRYDPSRGAAYYMVKTFRSPWTWATGRDCDWDIAAPPLPPLSI
jgi:hypothetical protein